jgi:hypothetical protein
MKTSPTSTPASPKGQPTTAPADAPVALLVKRHLRCGWWALLVYLTLGLVLESLHGFKVGAYVKVTNETRRLMWTLAHAHGTLLGLVNLGFAGALRAITPWPENKRRFASLSLFAATMLMPAGFFLGGLFIYGGDPGLGVLLVPIGGAFLFVAVLLTVLALERSR